MSVYEDEFGPMELNPEERRILLDLLDIEAEALDRPAPSVLYGTTPPAPAAEYICYGQAFSWPGRLN